MESFRIFMKSANLIKFVVDTVFKEKIKQKVRKQFDYEASNGHADLNGIENVCMTYIEAVT